MDMVTRRVILWSAPRTVSTAFERSMRTLSHCKVLHEPYGDPFYFGPEKRSKRFAHTPTSPRSTATYDDTTAMVSAEFPGVEAVFVKDMAFYVEDTYKHIMASGLRTFTHTFLIRRPDKAVYSLYKSGEAVSNGYGAFDPSEAGFLALYKVYQHAKEISSEPTVVIDADDLLSAPDEVMEAYCKAVGIRYQPGMTKWEPGMVEDWKAAGGGWLPDWYTEVAQSSGFIKRPKKPKGSLTPEIPSDIPDEVSTCILESWPVYQEMHKARLLVDL